MIEFVYLWLQINTGELNKLEDQILDQYKPNQTGNKLGILKTSQIRVAL